MAERRVPRIRFKGFEEDWEQRKFNELYERNDERNNGQFGQNKTISISTMTFNELGNGAADSSIDFYKVLRLGDIAFEGHTNKEFRYGRFGLNDIGNGIMSPRFTTLRPITKQEFTFWKYYIHDERVMRQKLVRSTKAGTMMNELVIDDLMRQSILVPSLSEQKKTGDYFKGLDHLLSLHQRKLEKLKILKKAMLEKMFPKNGAKVPEIRFSGFTDDWEQRKFNELYERNDERNNGQFGQNKTISISTMTFNELGNGAADSSIDFYKVLRLGDIAFEGHTNKEFRYGRFGLNDIGNGIMSPRFTTLRPITKQEFTFWKYYIHDERVMRQKLVRSTKAGTMMNELVIDDLMRQSILVPSLSEQKKTGDYFKGLDHLLSLHQRKLEKLRQIKKSMLERMFV